MPALPSRGCLEDAGTQVSVISRSGEDTYQTLTERHADAVLVVNATPVGMYPNCPATPVPEKDLAQLKNLAGVLDVIYNPTRTGIVLAAERLGIPAETGLSMLVAQALRSSELFQGRELDVSLVDQIEAQILSETGNVILIGMPGCGKTTTGKRLARMLGRPFVDIDDAIEASTGESAAYIISTQGEHEFRRVESVSQASMARARDLSSPAGAAWSRCLPTTTSSTRTALSSSLTGP